MSMPFAGDGDLTGEESSGTLDTGSTISAEQQPSDTPSDLGVSAENGQAQHDSQATAEDVGNVRFNPKWNGLLSKIPNEFHNIVAEDLKEWDRNYGQLSQNFAPWKQFSQQGITPETLQSAYQLYQVMQANPVEIYRRLGEALKDQLPQQQEQQQEDTEEEEYSEDTNQFDISSNPQYQQLQQQVEQMQQMLTQQYQSQQEEQYSQQIETTLNQIEEKHGAFDRVDVLNRVASQLQRGEQPDIIKAYEEQQAFVQNILAQHQVKPSAPTVMPTNGGLPPNASPAKLDTEQGRADKFAELLRLTSGS